MDPDSLPTLAPSQVYPRRSAPHLSFASLRAFRPSVKTAATVAWSLGALNVALIIGAIGLAAINHIHLLSLSYLVFVLACAIVGAVVAAARPANPVGWLFTGSALGFALIEFTGEYAIYGLFTRPGALPAAHALAWPSTWLWVPGIMLVVVFLPLFFPDGRLPSPRWQPLARLEVIVAVAIGVVAAIVPRVTHEAGGDNGPGLANPLGISGLQPVADLSGGIASLLLALMMLASASSLILRFRSSTGALRAQMKWLTYAIATTLALFVLERLFPPLTPITVLVLCAIPVAVGIAVLRYRLYDIDHLINRTLVYAALTAIVACVYVLLVGFFTRALHLRDTSLIAPLATGVVAVLFQPLRERLQRAVNRLLYGQRDEPYAVLSRLSRRLEETLAPDAVLSAIVETVASALKLPYVGIAVQEAEGPRLAAAQGATAPNPVRLPLIYQREAVGHLLLAPRAGSDDFTPADRRLLDDLARQAGVAVHAVQLTAALQHSRERLVSAREEERRRLRRDLHDGLGPMLASLTLKLDAARMLLTRDAVATERLLVDLKEQTKGAVADIRRLVYALRPPALDDLGLCSALREQAMEYEQGGLRITVEVPEHLPPLPAAVEVAAFRIAQEALTNVVRHAHARSCMVCLSLAAGAICLEIRDDGRGIPPDRRAGVGLSSMRERADELGGTCEIDGLPSGGTRVRAVLPCPAEVDTAPRSDERHSRGGVNVEALRVLIADDHPFFRDGVRVLLDAVAETEVVGEAATGEDAVVLAERLQPDVVLMDLNMPGTNGIEATRRIMGTSPHIRILVLTMFEDDDSVFAALRAGACGYLLKGSDQEELLRAITAVGRGEAIFGPAIARRVLAYFAAPRQAPPQAFPDLTEREREVLALIAQGRSNTEIAQRLYLSQKTVRNHVSNIFTKLQVADRAQAIVRAREEGLG